MVCRPSIMPMVCRPSIFMALSPPVLHYLFHIPLMLVPTTQYIPVLAMGTVGPPVCSGATIFGPPIYLCRYPWYAANGMPPIHIHSVRRVLHIEHRGPIWPAVKRVSSSLGPVHTPRTFYHPHRKPWQCLIADQFDASNPWYPWCAANGVPPIHRAHGMPPINIHGSRPTRLHHLHHIPLILVPTTQYIPLLAMVTVSPPMVCRPSMVSMVCRQWCAAHPWCP
jgi:hypothetical protein